MLGRLDEEEMEEKPLREGATSVVRPLCGPLISQGAGQPGVYRAPSADSYHQTAADGTE